MRAALPVASRLLDYNPHATATATSLQHRNTSSNTGDKLLEVDEKMPFLDPAGLSPPFRTTDHVQVMEEGAMVDPATAPWGLSISDADFEKLRAGFEPADQDDKWRVSVADLDQSSNISITLSRSGTGKKLYSLVVKPIDGGSGVKIEAITWEQNKGGIHISEEQGKKEVVIILRSLLECDFNALPDYDRSLLWNHPAAQIDAN